MPTHADLIYTTLLNENIAPAHTSRPLPADPPFPDRLLPEPLATWASRAAAATGCPLPFIVFPALAATGALIGPRLALRLQPAWIELPTLWVALIAPSGHAKSVALSRALAPFAIIQDERVAASQAGRAAVAASVLTSELTTALQLALSHVPRPPRKFLASDFTIKAIERRLRLSPGLALVHDDLTAFAAVLARERAIELHRLRAFWTAHGLDYAEDTTGHANGNSVLSLIGTLQPHRIPTLTGSRVDGFLESFLPVFPVARLAPWPTTGSAVPPASTPEAIAAWLQPLSALADAGPNPPQAIVDFAPDAVARWAAWYNANLATAQSSSPVVAAFERKLPIQLARLTLVFHALWHRETASHPVTRHTLDRAIALVEYIRVHIHRVAWVLGCQVSPESTIDTLAHRIRHALTEGWTARTALAIALGRPETARLDAALAALQRDRLIDSRIVKPRGRDSGRRRTEYRLLPTSPEASAAGPGVAPQTADLRPRFQPGAVPE